jgi:mono/diheme cytochrome c family protein
MNVLDQHSRGSCCKNHKPPRRWRAVALTVLATVLALAAAAFVFIYSGAYSVAATDGHSKPVEWAVRTAAERSIRAHARDVAVPAGMDLRDPQLAKKAFGHYSAACVTCHAAPGRGPDPWVVLYPSAPDLTRAEVVSRRTDRELFWIIKHGIKDTGMLALGPTHKDDDVWAVAAFVQQLPGMTPEQYQAMSREYEAARKVSATDGKHHH